MDDKAEYACMNSNELSKLVLITMKRFFREEQIFDTSMVAIIVIQCFAISFVNFINNVNLDIDATKRMFLEYVDYSQQQLMLDRQGKEDNNGHRNH